MGGIRLDSVVMHAMLLDLVLMGWSYCVRALRSDRADKRMLKGHCLQSVYTMSDIH
jgi:hypothetical protein